MTQHKSIKTLKTGTPIPIYYQLQAIIRGKIENGRWESGRMIPAERQLAKAYKVSIGTVKKAILNLVNEGYLHRFQGKGTFVKSTILRRESLRYYRFLDAFGGEENDLSVKPIQLKRISGFHPANNYLKISPGKDLFELQRIFFLKNIPVVFSISYLPANLFKNIDKIPFPSFAQKTLYVTIEEEYGLPTIRNCELIGAIFPSTEVCKALQINKNNPVLHIEMLAFTYKNKPFEYRRAYCATPSLRIFREY
jgi:GntR family transcriptional regulator